MATRTPSRRPGRGAGFRWASASADGACTTASRSSSLDIAVDPREPAGVYHAIFVRGFVMVPVCSCEPIGAIGVVWRERRDFAGETPRGLRALADATGTALAAVLDSAEAERTEVNESRGAVDTAGREIVRMCAWTRRILHDGRWISLEAFPRSRFGLVVSRGISEDAMASFEHEFAEQ